MTRRAATSVLLVLAAASACSRGGDPANRAELVRLRADKDLVMRGAESPFSTEGRKSFHGLRYFGADPSWDVRAVLDPTAAGDTIGLLTSKGTHDRFERVGRVLFERRGKKYSLVLYRSLAEGTLFLPFSDATSGRETYGAGRYLDPVATPEGALRLDFNRAYNPYCAYDTRWICPIAPPENRLDVRVTAGEKTYDAH